VREGRRERFMCRARGCGRDYKVVGPGDLGRQTEVVLESLSKALAAAGATPADAVRLGIYVKDTAGNRLR
jgi:enamine deaminase RidA (YjgF/YER057c/UK114 family)